MANTSNAHGIQTRVCAALKHLVDECRQHDLPDYASIIDETAERCRLSGQNGGAPPPA